MTVGRAAHFMMASQRPSSVGKIGEPGYSPRGTGTPGRQSSEIGPLPLPAAGPAVPTASARGCGAGRGPAAEAGWLLEGACGTMAGACCNAGIAVAACARWGLGGRAPGWYMAISGPGPAPAPVELRPSRAPPCCWPSKELCGDRWSELVDPADDAKGL